MQDRFRFRVWCKNTNQWEKDIIKIDNIGNYTIHSNNFLTKVITNEEPMHHIINFCTGLKDANGKLIYEGDILKDTESNAVAVVKFFNYGFMAHIQRMDDIIPLGDIEYLSNNGQTPFKIIGNVYENKELME